MNSQTDSSGPHRFRISWDAWILIVLGILGILILAVRRGDLDRVSEKSVVPIQPETSAEPVLPESNWVEPVRVEPEPVEIAPSSAVLNEIPQTLPVPTFRERITADGGIMPMDSLIAFSRQRSSLLLPSGVMVSLTDPDAVVWIPLGEQTSSDSSTLGSPSWTYPDRGLVSVTDCTGSSQTTIRDSSR